MWTAIEQLWSAGIIAEMHRGPKPIARIHSMSLTVAFSFLTTLAKCSVIATMKHRAAMFRSPSACFANLIRSASPASSRGRNRNSPPG